MANMLAVQFLCHLIGHYVLRTDWLVDERARNFQVALLQDLLYIVPFALLLELPPYPLAVIWISHAVLSRWRVGDALGMQIYLHVRRAFRCLIGNRLRRSASASYPPIDWSRYPGLYHCAPSTKAKNMETENLSRHSDSLPTILPPDFLPASLTATLTSTDTLIHLIVNALTIYYLS